MARGIGNRQKKIDVGKEARRRARQHGQPPAARVIPDKRRKPPKHKQRFTEDDFA
jgi:hypothetical protein